MSSLAMLHPLREEIPIKLDPNLANVVGSDERGKRQDLPRMYQPTFSGDTAEYPQFAVERNACGTVLGQAVASGAGAKL